eukprot:4624147-Amphidinium_carterae.1
MEASRWRSRQLCSQYLRYGLRSMPMQCGNTQNAGKESSRDSSESSETQRDDHKSLPWVPSVLRLTLSNRILSAVAEQLILYVSHKICRKLC